MNISRHDDGDAVIRLLLDGELDMCTADDLMQQAEQVLSPYPPRHLVIDATGLSFCDSHGLGALLQVRDHTNKQGTAFSVTGAHGVTQRTMQITGVWELLTTPA